MFSNLTYFEQCSMSHPHNIILKGCIVFHWLAALRRRVSVVRVGRYGNPGG